MAVAGLAGWLALFQADGSPVSLTTLVSFRGTNGAAPYAGLLRSEDGTFYGTTSAGGADGDWGTVFRLTTNGTLTPLASFTGINGANPYGGLVQDANGILYGTTAYGGPNFSGFIQTGFGTIYRITTNGALTPLFFFAGTNGSNPFGGLTQGIDGNFYGTTFLGGASNLGTLFQLTTNGTFRMLLSFGGTNGGRPYAGLLATADGNLYGTTVKGGTNGDWGTVFRATTNGILTSLASLNGSNGASPYGGLTQDSDGVLYGTTTYGGIGFSGAAQSGLGTVFRITTNGVFETLHLLAGGPGGANPRSRLVRGKEGNLYGTTILGGAHGSGMAFQITTNGVFNSLYSFNPVNDDGISPYGELAPGDYNSFVGTASSAGANLHGTIFRLDPSAPLLQTTGSTDGTFRLSWNALIGQIYQVQYITNLNQSGWINLKGALLATNATTTISDPIETEAKRYYRVVLFLSP